MFEKVINAILPKLEEIGKFCFFTGKFLTHLFTFQFNVKETIKQSYLIGFKTLGLVALTAFILGSVLTIQSRPTLEEFGAESWLPAMVAVSIVREMGPVITALIFAGKVGSGIGAELGSMRVTEQIDAMEVSGVNAYKHLVTSRVMATILMLPLLVVWADAIGLFGSFVAVNLKGHTSFALFNTQVFEKLSYMDIIPAFIKTILFGLAIGIISCYFGFKTKGGTVGVGSAANAAVVISSIAIFIIDFLAAEILGLIM